MSPCKTLEIFPEKIKLSRSGPSINSSEKQARLKMLAFRCSVFYNITAEVVEMKIFVCGRGIKC